METRDDELSICAEFLQEVLKTISFYFFLSLLFNSFSLCSCYAGNSGRDVSGHLFYSSREMVPILVNFNLTSVKIPFPKIPIVSPLSTKRV